MKDPSSTKPNSIYKRLSRSAGILADKIKMRENSFVLTVAVLIGIIGGFGAVGIQYLIKEFQLLFWGGEFNLETINQTPLIYKILIPLAGGIFVGLIIQFAAREAKGHGVPEVMDAIIKRNGIIRPRVVFAKLLASAVYIVKTHFTLSLTQFQHEQQSVLPSDNSFG